MKKNLLLSISILLALTAGLYAQPKAPEADEILGIWLTGSKKGKVEIYKCGDRYCGKLVWLKEPTYEDGTQKIDKKNPDPALQKRPVKGLNILTDFEYDEDLEWEDGEIYDPENGKTYSCEIWMDEEDRNILNVRGYIGISLIGRTDVWERSSLE